MSDFKQSPLKWVGSKNKVLPQLFEFSQFKKLWKYDGFVEPFVGAGNVFLNVEHDNITISDNNPDLINFYKVVKNNFNKFLTLAKIKFQNTSSDEYYKNRKIFNSIGGVENSIEKAVLFIYLNKVGFRGLCRYSEKSGFNVSFGHYKTVNFPEELLINLHKKLQNVTIKNKSFVDTLRNVEHKNFLYYCDPPYFETFDAYTKDGFNTEDHIILNGLCINSKSDVILSNSIEAKNIYTPDDVKDIIVKRGIGSRSIKESVFIYNS